MGRIYGGWPPPITLLSLVIVVGVIIAFIVLITVVLLVVLLFLFFGLASATGGFLLLALLLLDRLDLLLVHRRHVLLSHKTKLNLNLFPFVLLLALELLGPFDFGTTGSDLGVGGGLGPLSGRIRLHLASRDLELDEGLEAAQEPLLDELGQNDTKLARGRVNLAAKLVGQSQDDLLELEEHDLDTLDEDDVLRDDFFPPAGLQIDRLRFDALAARLIFHFGLLFGHILVDGRLLGVFVHLGNLCLLPLDFLNLSLPCSHTGLPSLDLLVHREQKRVLLDISAELVLCEFVAQSSARSVIPFNDLNDLLRGDM